MSLKEWCITLANMIETQIAGNHTPELFIATIANYSSSLGSTLILPGSDTPTEKRYMRVSSPTLANGYKVLVAKVSGTYLILGRVH